MTYDRVLIKKKKDYGVEIKYRGYYIARSAGDNRWEVFKEWKLIETEINNLPMAKSHVDTIKDALIIKNDLICKYTTLFLGITAIITGDAILISIMIISAVYLLISSYKAINSTSKELVRCREKKYLEREEGKWERDLKRMMRAYNSMIRKDGCLVIVILMIVMIRVVVA